MTSSNAERFHERFGGRPTVVEDAPGRVNLMGEHTDYNDGYVLPVAIPQRTRVWLAKRRDKRARVISAELSGADPIAFDVGSERPGRGWIDYVAGVTNVLGRRGSPIAGFDALISSDVPVGRGLSSSAALEVSFARALRAAFSLVISDSDIAEIAHEAETRFVGVPVGTMDQMACALADEGTALFLDTRTGNYRRVPIPPSVEVIVVDSGVRRDLATADYGVRRAECVRAANLLTVASLRDVDESALIAAQALPEPLGRRVRHVLTESRRVVAAVGCLETNDLPGLGHLFDSSHASMRDDYEVSVPAVDALVDSLKGAGAAGARLTGGGFGGCVVAVASTGSGGPIVARALEYHRQRGYRDAQAVLVGGSAA